MTTQPLLIAGPCSAETEQQVHETAARLARTGRVQVLRAGIWKPRTKPGGFEGVGTPGLQWLAEAGRAHGLPVTTEVATARHVEEALKHGLTHLWVGARTTVNPFSVQEVADALQGTGVEVWIKNPVNPDLELWTGALERMAKAGLTRLGLIHRGFSRYGQSAYRNAPLWELAVEMKRRHPGVPIVTDPSHICGRRDTLLAVSRRALDLGFDGLMVESHCDPDNAWSDARQQITPEALNELMDSLMPHTTPSENHPLDSLREQINHLDEELIQLLATRMRVAGQIGEWKQTNSEEILQPTRWNEVKARALQHGTGAGLSEAFLQRYLEAVHTESIQRQGGR